MTFNFTCVLISFTSVGFRNIAAHSVDHYVLFLFCNFSIFSFGLEGWILVLIASVPGFCILFNFHVQFHLMKSP